MCFVCLADFWGGMLNLLFLNATKNHAKPESFGTSPANQMSPGLSFRVFTHGGIARRAGRSPSAARKLPEQKPRSPRRMVGTGKPLRASPWEWRDTTKPSGVVRGECRGGLGGAAAPNRPPSAARRAGGPSNRKEKPPCPQGAENTSRRTDPDFLLLVAAATKTTSPRRLAAQAAQTK